MLESGESSSPVSYPDFINRKSQLGGEFGFEPTNLPSFLFPFQRALVEWSLRKGRAGIFADCGLGKTAMQLVWSDSIADKSNGRVLLLSPLAVGKQTEAEGKRWGIDCAVSRDGSLASDRIVIVNYEKLHLFRPEDFKGIACDESSILKHFTGETQKAVTRFSCKMPFRSLWTATAAPNDYTELGTSSEALGYLGHSDMLTRFFKQDDNKKCRMNDVKLAREANTGNHFAKLAYRVSQQMSGWRLKGHAHEHFWRWVCSWARACRKPSDLGFSDDGFNLPQLIEREHIIKPETNAEGMLFTLPVFGLKEEREERRRTTKQRCSLVADLVSHDRPAVVWCHLNDEGDRLEKMIPGAIQVKGANTDEDKEDSYARFQDGTARVLVIKPKIGAWGLNWQHCHDVVTFASHSYEQYYQSIRRCWRFGQTNSVTVDVIASEGERYVRENMVRKAAAASAMFSELVKEMNNSVGIKKTTYTKEMELPAWL
jgi:hypothetical protein